MFVFIHTEKGFEFQRTTIPTGTQLTLFYKLLVYSKSAIDYISYYYKTRHLHKRIMKPLN